MIVTLFDGPLDGLQIDLPETVDKFLIIDDRGRAHRYETDGEWEVIKSTPGGETTESGADMRLSNNPDEFDHEIRLSLTGWDKAI